jgi:hypothetical protein
MRGERRHGLSRTEAKLGFGMLRGSLGCAMFRLSFRIFAIGHGREHVRMSNVPLLETLQTFNWTKSEP